jgi:hypothetical protein
MHSVWDADGSTVLHHIARAKQDAEAMLRELKKHQQSALDGMLDAADGNGDTPLLVACDGETMQHAQQDVHLVSCRLCVVKMTFQYCCAYF